MVFGRGDLEGRAIYGPDFEAARCLLSIVWLSDINVVAMESAIITAEATVNVGTAQARRWFMELETHPERYRFETHAGFAFTQDNGRRFGEIGASFHTWEQFYGLKLTLRFELVEVGEMHFRFRLTRPPLPVWGAFVIQETCNDTTHLRLEIGGTNRLGKWLLRFPLVRGAVQRQIRGEVEHIKTSMEAACLNQRMEEPNELDNLISEQLP
jgi:hypothetical protein